MTNVQNEILDALAPHVNDKHVEPSEFDSSVWVQVNAKWALIEPVCDRSYQVTTGYEAGFDLAGGEKIEPNVVSVSGIRFGVVPRVLTWVDQFGKARPVKN